MKKIVVYATMVMTAWFLTGCIPPNEHVGKPPPHSYKDPYYGGYGYGYGYHEGYYRPYGY